MRHRRLVPLFAAALVLTGCSAGGDVAATSSAPATAAASSPAATTPAPPASTSTPAVPETVELAMGDTLTTDMGNTITVHSFESHIPYQFPADEGDWFAADVEYCLAGGVPDPVGFQNFQFDWVARTEQGWTLDTPSSYWDDIKSPLLHTIDVAPQLGECYRGWVLFDGPAEATVKSVNLAEVSWAVPQGQ